MSSSTSSSSHLPILLTSLAKGAKSVNSLPLSDDHAFQCAFKEYASLTHDAKSLVSRMLSDCLLYDNKEKEGEEEDEEEEVILEKSIQVSEEFLDRVERFIENGGMVVEQQPSKFQSSNNNSGTKFETMVKNVVDMEKPQTTYSFLSEMNNSRSIPFHPPYILRKFHTSFPLDLTPQPGHGIQPLPPQEQVETIIAPDSHYPHPYQYEISNLTYHPSQLQPPPPPTLTTIAEPDSTCHYISTPTQLQSLASSLSSSITELAIDLEAHSYRSFAGFVCLLQLSTRNTTPPTDYLIDTLELRKHIHANLAPLFANPSIVKIMHGSHSDILWLQRDFGIYVVNLFDTGVAARQLGCKSAGLAYVLKKYVGIQVDKTFQLRDWRVRPLSDEMKEYARGDTRYLMQVYDAMRRDLISSQHASIESVLEASQQLALRRYTTEPFYPDRYRQLIRHSKHPLTSNQLEVLKRLYDWRDGKARQLDESLHYVCPNGALVRLALKGSSLEGAKWTKVMEEYRAELEALLMEQLPASNEESSPVLQSTQIYEMAKWLTPPAAATAPPNPISSSDDEEVETKSSQIRLHPHNQNHTCCIPSDHGLDFRQSKRIGYTIHSVPVRDDVTIGMQTAKEELRRECQVLHWQPPEPKLEPTAETTTHPPEPLQQEEDVMPKSMKDIYQMTHRNRKRKQSETSKTTLPSKDDATTEETTIVMDYFQQQQTSTDDEQMIRDVGWKTCSSKQSKSTTTTTTTSQYDYSNVGDIGAMAGVVLPDGKDNPFFAGAALTTTSGTFAKQPKKDEKAKKSKQTREHVRKTGDRMFVYKEGDKTS